MDDALGRIEMVVFGISFARHKDAFQFCFKREREWSKFLIYRERDISQKKFQIFFLLNFPKQEKIVLK